MLRLNLQFNEAQHKYYDGNTNKELISATTLIGRYKDKFNTYYWSMFTGLKDNLISVKPDKKQTHIIVNGVRSHIDNLYNNDLYKDLALKTQELWRIKTEKSHIRGNKIHNHLEEQINISRDDLEAKDNKKIQPIKQTQQLTEFRTINDLNKTDLWDTYPDIYKRFEAYIRQGCVILAEKKIYNSRYFVAGMIDVLVVNHLHKQFCIDDWKSNKDKIWFVSGYYRKKLVNGEWIKSNNFIQTDDRMKYPLDNLQTCKGNVYSLQLSLYAYMMEAWGYSLVKNGLNIYHFRPDMEPKLLNVKYYKAEIQKMLNHYANVSNEKEVKREKKLRQKLKKDNINFGIV